MIKAYWIDQDIAELISMISMTCISEVSSLLIPWSLQLNKALDLEISQLAPVA